MNGAAAMVRCLEAEGITRIFGYPGWPSPRFMRRSLPPAPSNTFWSARNRLPATQPAVMRRIARKPAVCVTSSGPGAANLITALATAYADSIPMVAITGQVNSSLLGRDVFQEADMRGATESFVKYSDPVKNPDEIPRIMKEAFYIASTGRKGPVLIDIPCDVQMASLKKPFSYPQEVKIRGYKPSTRGNDQQMNKVIAAIRKAERPLVCAGGGVILGNAGGVSPAVLRKKPDPAGDHDDGHRRSSQGPSPVLWNAGEQRKALCQPGRIRQRSSDHRGSQDRGPGRSQAPAPGKTGEHHPH